MTSYTAQLMRRKLIKARNDINEIRVNLFHYSNIGHVNYTYIKNGQELYTFGRMVSDRSINPMYLLLYYF